MRDQETMITLRTEDDGCVDGCAIAAHHSLIASVAEAARAHSRRPGGRRAIVTGRRYVPRESLTGCLANRDSAAGWAPRQRS
ncbi:MAG TPA: hypothetical protein VE871_10315, partial [Longimicrobium sp.]|nr:hypothetical protein [Longimicrobium sp.]